MSGRRPRRCELRDLVDALLRSFTSRNNDLDGYWALGRLLTAADELHARELVLDLRAGASRPECEVGARVARRWRDVLVTHCARRGLDVAQIGVARILLRLRVAGSVMQRQQPQPGEGEPCECQVQLGGDAPDDYQAERWAVAWVWPHDPRRESPSTRVADGLR